VVSVAFVTFPEGSTSTRTLTLILPVIVLLALCGTSGMTWRITSPWDVELGTALVFVGLPADCALRAAGGETAPTAEGTGGSD
jgi:hypothetical protein